MKITMIGSGYVGLVSATCFAEMGHEIVCLDLDAKKIENLKAGIVPIHEPGLEEMIKRNIVAGRLSFTTNIQAAAEHGDVQFIAVGTPPSEDGSADLSYVLSAAKNIARYMSRYTVVVNKSTVPMGSAGKVELAIRSVLVERGQEVKFSVVSNPEFLKEGAAIEDFMRPDRIVIGTDSDQAFAIMQEIYGAFTFKSDRIIRMDNLSAELTKYAANSMLATRISFMNNLARLAEQAGANIDHVRKGMGSDSRIGPSFLYAGAGYGGSCFPKDVQALVRTGEEYGVSLPILKAVEQVNDGQKQVLAEKVITHFGDLTGMKFAVWGLAFKPNTDDMREAPSTPMIQRLILAGAEVVCYDPVAQKEAEKIYAGERAVSFSHDAIGALIGADALIIVTEWKEFRAPPWDTMKRDMKNPIIFDGRNVYQPEVPRKHGFEYFSIGRPGAEACLEKTSVCFSDKLNQKKMPRFCEAFLLLHQFFQKSHIFIETCYIFQILMMKDFAFLRDKDDIVTSERTDIRDTVIEAAAKEVASHGSTCMLSREYHSKAIVSDFVREDIRYESVRKKRFTKS